LQPENFLAAFFFCFHRTEGGEKGGWWSVH
jgi:hypothetical protein